MLWTSLLDDHTVGSLLFDLEMILNVDSSPEMITNVNCISWQFIAVIITVGDADILIE